MEWEPPYLGDLLTIVINNVSTTWDDPPSTPHPEQLPPSFLTLDPPITGHLSPFQLIRIRVQTRSRLEEPGPALFQFLFRKAL